MRTASQRVIAVAVLSLVALAGCGQNQTGRKFRAERDLWRAQRMERSLGLQVREGNRPDDAAIRPVQKAYARILELHGMPSGPSSRDSSHVRSIGMIRAQADRGVIRMDRLRGDSTAVIEHLDRARKAYPWSDDLTLGFAVEQIAALRALGRSDDAVTVCQEIASQIQVRAPNGRTRVPVMDAPIWAADLLVEAGRQEEALAELDRADIYYRELVNENPNDQTAALAWVQIGLAATRRGRFDRAVEAVERARRVPGATEIEPRILFVLGTLQQESRRDYPEAAAVFGELAERFPDDPLAPEALVRHAASLADAGAPDQALSALARLDEKYPRDRTSVPSGRLLAARILTRLNRWPDALSRYRSLMADFPTSDAALGAPLEIAGHYAQAGEAEAARSTLQRAVEEYGRVRTEKAGGREAVIAGEIEVVALSRLERWAEAADRLIALTVEFPGQSRNPMRMVEAAAIVRNRLNDPIRAAGILDRLAEQYPQSPLASRAREEAASLRGK